MLPEQNNDNRLHGLIARLELDSDLGVRYVAHGGEISSFLKTLREPAAPPVPPRRREPSQPKWDEKNTSSLPVGEQGRRSSPPPRVLGDTHPTLVPIPEVAVNPDKDAALAELRARCMQCSECELCERRTTVVWGEGSLDASVMFIGEGPGRDEDREGRPFVGRSGRLLTDIIEKGMQIPRGGVYITNVVKCRPPGNRDPKPGEVSACSRYLKAQIAVIRPKILVLVGGVAGCALLGVPPKTPGLRGKWHDYEGIPMRVIFHPSYLLRQRRSENDRTEADRQTWKDIQEVMTRLAAM